MEMTELFRRAKAAKEIHAELSTALLPSRTPDAATFDSLIKDLRRVLWLYRDGAGTPDQTPTVETDAVSSPQLGGES